MNGMWRALLGLVTIARLSAFTGQEPTQALADALEQGFTHPPDSAKPRTWWHWTGGNVTKEGIVEDLEWMKRVGIAGAQLADVSFGSGQTAERKIA